MNIQMIVLFLEGLPSKIRVILTNLLTMLIALQTVVTVVIAQAGDVPGVIEYGTPVVTGLAAVILFVRRVTPVSKSDRGIN